MAESYVFGNHKGGVGKTMLCFHTACQIAKMCPEKNILVIDFTELGDLSKQFFGGVAVRDMNEIGLGERYMGDQEERKNTTTDMFQDVNEEFRSDYEDKELDITKKLGKMKIDSFDILKYATKPSVVRGDGHIPSNLYLIASAGNKQKNKAHIEGTLQTIHIKFKAIFEEQLSNWIVLMDTDGDRTLSMFSKMAFAIARYAVIPLETDPTDFKRVKTLLLEIYNMRKAHETSVQVKKIIWNKVPSYKDEASSVSKLFTPAKLDLQMAQGLNGVILSIAEIFPHLFAAPTIRRDEFVKSISTSVRTFGANGSLAAFFGIPFSTTIPLKAWPKVKIGNEALPVANAIQVEKVKKNIEELAHAILEEVEVDDDSTRRTLFGNNVI